MTPIFRLLLTASIGFFVIAGAEFFKANAATDLPPDPKRGGELDDGAEYDLVPAAMWEHGAKVALGNNANVVLLLDLISDGGAGNRVDDGVTTGAVSGRGTKIALEIFATGVTTSLRGVILRFFFDASLVSFVKAENNAFSLSLPEGSVGAALAATSPATLASSGFLARAEFETVADVTGRAFSIGIESVTLAESSTSSDVLRTSSEISFNSAPSPDFDGDGTVGFSDFLTFAGAFGSSQGDGKYNAAQDLNSDGSVDFTDFLIFAGEFGSQVPPSGGGDFVTIADDSLRAVIADSLGKAPDSPITREEMETLTRISAPNRGIRSLSGLEHAGNLGGLNLGEVRVADGGGWVNSNDISDLSPLSSLTNLKSLILSRNSISNLSALSNLTNLTGLSLNYNSITDISALSNLTNLAHLRIVENSISDISALSNLTDLRYLLLWENSISDISALSNLTNLEFLILNRNSISNLSALSNLTNLTQLSLDHNRFTDISALSNLTNLDYLNLEGNSISDISALSNLTNLETLFLWRTAISDISALTNLTNLKHLYLSNNTISDISVLSKLSNLKWLFLYDNSISAISALSNLTNLTSLGLAGNSISDIVALSRLTKLSFLNLGENSISEISPLVANTGLGDGDRVDLRNNPLSSISRNTHIPALQSRGVKVEFDNSNGNGGGGTTTGTPDLIVESPSVDDNTLTAGQSFTLSATVRNQGNVSAAATTLRYFRSSNATISTDDTEVGTDAVSTLTAGATSAESISMNAPSSAGTYHYGACVDGVSGESDTDNNCSSGVSVTVSGGGSTSNLGACRVGLVVRPNQSCSVSGGSFRNIGGGCYNFTPFGSGRICSASFNLNGLQGTRAGDDFRITAVP